MFTCPGSRRYAHKPGVEVLGFKSQFIGKKTYLDPRVPLQHITQLSTLRIISASQAVNRSSAVLGKDNDHRQTI